MEVGIRTIFQNATRQRSDLNVYRNEIRLAAPAAAPEVATRAAGRSRAAR